MSADNLPLLITGDRVEALCLAATSIYNYACKKDAWVDISDPEKTQIMQTLRGIESLQETTKHNTLIMLNVMRAAGSLSVTEIQWLQKFTTLGRQLFNAMNGRDLEDRFPIPKQWMSPTEFGIFLRNVSMLEEFLPPIQGIGARQV